MANVIRKVITLENGQDWPLDDAPAADEATVAPDAANPVAGDSGDSSGILAGAPTGDLTPAPIALTPCEPGINANTFSHMDRWPIAQIEYCCASCWERQSECTCSPWQRGLV